MSPSTWRRSQDASVGALCLVLALSGPIGYFFSDFVDGSRKVRDASGQLVWESHGNTASYVLYLALALALYIALRIFLDRNRGDGMVPGAPMPVRLMVTSAWVVAAAHLYRYPSSSAPTVVAVVAAAAILTVVSRSLITDMSLRPLAYIGRWVSLTTLAYYLVAASAANPCRVDKCTFVGELVKGYFPQENTLAMFVCLTVPFSGYRPRRAFIYDCVLAALVVLLTGSRMAMLLLPVAVMGGILLRMRLGPGGRLPKWFGLFQVLPLAMISLSTAIYAVAAVDQLTGRGLIYQITKRELEHHWLLGPGREVFQIAFEDGRSAGFLIAHEHGEMPYLVTNGGLVAGATFLLFLISLCVMSVAHWNPLGLAILSPASVAFATEPIWEFSVRSPFFFAVVAFVAMTIATETQVQPWAQGEEGEHSDALLRNLDREF